MNKPKRNRRNYIGKPRVSKKLIMSTAASVMAVTIAASLLWNAMKVSVPVEAQNTMSGVSEALKDHGSGEAFIILDIVPGTASDELPLGTIGYLTSGQSPLEQRLEQTFNNDADGTYKNYNERKNEADRLAGLAAVSADGEYKYEYRESLTGGSSWIKIYGGRAWDRLPGTFEVEYMTVVKGSAKDVGEGAGAYVEKAETTRTVKTNIIPADNTNFFKQDGSVSEGFEITVTPVSDDLSVYSEDTPVYVFENGKYEYRGTIGSISNYDIPSEEKPAEAEPDKAEPDNTEPEETEPANTEPANTEPAETEPEETEPAETEPVETEQDPSDSPDGSGADGPNNDGGNSDTDGDNDPIQPIDVGSADGPGWIKFVDGEADAADGDGQETKEANESLGSEPEGESNGEGTVTESGDETDGDEPADESKKETETGNEDTNGENNDTVNSQQPPVQEAQAPEPEEASAEEQERPEYLILEFKYVSGDEPIDGLYWPEKYDTEEVISYEEPEEEEVNEEEARPFSMRRARAAGTNVELVYVGAGNGNIAITAPAKDDPDATVTAYNAPTYFRCFDVDLLKEYVFCDSGLNIKVNVKSAADVNPNDVMNADLIYLENAECILGGDDMSPQTVFSIIDRAVNDLTPVIVDNQVSRGGGDGYSYMGSNYQKLADILLMTDLYSFFQDMEENVDDMLINADTGEYGRKADTDNNYVNNNIYVVDSGNNLSDRSSFNTEFGDGDMEGFEEVKAAIDMENRQGNDLPGPGKAMAIQYIINYANGFIGEFRDFSILELQPTSGDSDLNTRNDSRNNTILYWRKMGSSGSGQQIIRSRKSITITVDTESVAQFSGGQDDINNKYEMIFIGLDGQNLNYEGKETVYNDSALNGKVYSGVGDIADGAGQRYEGIDITLQKKNALLEFMKAGYPIVVENNFFVNKTAKDANAGDINTDYIDASSQMYDFLRTALSDDGYKWCLYTIADAHIHSSDFAAQINVHRPDIIFDWDNPISELNLNEEKQGQIIQTIAADAEGKYRGYIPYKVTDDVGDSYNNSVNTRFYLDMNQDGRFDALEEVTGEGIAVVNGLLMVEFAAPERGSIPWKLEISDTGNGCRRDALTGYFQIAHSTQMPIRIVQVVGGTAEDSLDAKFNFESAYEISDRALLGYYLKRAEALTNTKLEIETMTVGQLAEEIKLNEEYLSGADVLVLGFGPECSLNVPVVDRNVEWYVNKYISEGRGVLLSSAASSEAAGRMQIAAAALGQKDVKTYSSLGNSKPSGVRFYKYSNLKSRMFGEWGMLSAQKVNDGTISHYPYEVSENVTLGNSVGIADYVLDLASNGASDTVSDVTAWYCLGDSAIFSDETSYRVSIKDAANNYYIYSKGNVVYIGENGYPYEYDNTVGAEPGESIQGTADCKLFVNALMEAYGVGIKNPKVTIVAGLSDDSSETDSICIPYDEQIREIEEADGALGSKGVLDDTVDVYFKVSEPNFAFRKVVTLAFYYEDEAGVPIDVGGRIVNATQFTSEIWTVDQNQLVPVTVTTGLDLVPGKIYKIKAPVISLRNDDNSVNADIYIVVQSHFIKLGQDRHPIGSDSVTLNRAQLFLLE